MDSEKTETPHHVHAYSCTMYIYVHNIQGGVKRSKGNCFIASTQKETASLGEQTWNSTLIIYSTEMNLISGEWPTTVQ